MIASSLQQLLGWWSRFQQLLGDSAGGSRHLSSELLAMGVFQFSLPGGVAEAGLLNRILETSVGFPTKTAKHKFAKFSSVLAPEIY